MFKALKNLISNIQEQNQQQKASEAALSDPRTLAARFKQDYIEGDLANDLPPYLKENLALLSPPETPFAILRAVRALELARRLIKHNYLNPLRLKRGQLIYKDEYGDYQFDAFNKEITKFVNSRFHLLANNYLPSEYYQEWARRLAATEAKRLAREYGTSSATTSLSEARYIKYVEHDLYDESMFNGCICDEMHEDITNLILLHDPEDISTEIALGSITDPYDYEAGVAKELESLGWTARATSGSGDQGVDVIATKQGIKLVIQCKLYSQPVGNSAVQEIHAAKGFERADIAAVVTNTSFTKSAKQLATALNVHLLHHDQLGEFAENLLDHQYTDDEPDPERKNTINICEIIAENLENMGWETSYDPEDPLNGDSSTILLYTETQKITVSCTAWESLPVQAEDIQLELKVFNNLKDEFEIDHLVITSATGFSQEAINLAHKYNQVLTLIGNAEIHRLADQFA